ncbi:MAG: M23 family metallopeptidase [Prochlorococcaceae cyanobacterium]
MPSVCFKALCAALLSAQLPLAVLLAGQGWSQPLSSSGRWRLGVFPVASFVRFTSHYGSRIGPGGSVEPHYGLDIAAPLGSAIHSWWGGVVQELINDGACGVGLVIRSGSYEHIYCHLAGSTWGGTYRSGPVSLSQGQAVATGQLIGHVGLSGRTSGPHLHWGVRYRGQWLDPARVLRAMVASRGASKRQPAPRVGGI